MARRTKDDLDILIAEITTDAYDEDEQLWAFQAAMEDLPLPVEAEVVGENVDLLKIHYDGEPRRGLVAVCKRKGRKHVVSLVDVVVQDGSVAEHIAAYRKWIGVDAKAEAKLAGKRTPAKAVDPTAPVEAVLLKVGENSARLRLLDGHEEVTLRAKRTWTYVPGQILTIKPRKRWTHNNYPYMSGEITDARIDIPALGLTPLTVEQYSVWEPKHQDPYRGPLAGLWKAIAKKGPRDAYDFEWVAPGFDPDRDEMPAVDEASQLYLAGDRSECRDILADVLMKDLRCIEAHMLLGTWDQDTVPRHALLHYEVAAGFIKHALGADFEGVLPWGDPGNRPVIVTLAYYAQCLWQLDRVDEAKAAFERVLWLCPSDPVDVRAALLDIHAGRDWGDRTITDLG